uniref:Uncharacterized protein n=1 Tax=Rhizophora mucronata TaxID=61149 RepID=A0A2P2PMT9_RHIMU
MAMLVRSPCLSIEKSYLLHPGDTYISLYKEEAWPYSPHFI